DSHTAAVHRNELERRVDLGTARDDVQLRVIETWTRCVENFDAHLARARPVNEQTRRQNAAEATVNPHERTLIVLQLDHSSKPLEHARLDDEVKLFVHELRRAK